MIAAVIVVGGIALTRLNEGPLDLQEYKDALTQEILKTLPPGHSLSLGEFSLNWTRSFEPLQIHINDLNIQGPKLSVTVPELHANISVLRLLIQNFLPGEIILKNPIVRYDSSKEESKGLPSLEDIPNIKVDNGSFDGFGYQLRGINALIEEGLGHKELQLTINTIQKEGLHLTPSLEVTGKIDNSQITLEAHVRNVHVDDMEAFWPGEKAKDAKNWLVPNLKKGTVPHIEMKIAGGYYKEAFTLQDLNGFIDFEGVEVRYLNGLTPLTDVKGRAYFTDKMFEIPIESGRLRDISLKGAKVHIKDLDKKDQFLSLEAQIQGPLKTALQTLNQKPLELLKGYPISPQNTSGNLEGSLQIDFPLENDLTLQRLNFGATGHLKNVHLIADLVNNPKMTLSQGILTLDLTRKGVLISGNIKAADTIQDLVWAEAFGISGDGDFPKNTPSSLQKRYLNIKGDLTPALMSSLGMDVQTYLKGRALSEFTFNEDLRGKKIGDMTFDLSPSQVTVELMGFTKAPKQKAIGRISFESSKNSSLILLKNLNLKGSNIFVQGSGTFNTSKKSFQSLTLNPIKLNDHHLMISMTPSGEGLKVNLSGDHLTLSHYLEQVVDDSSQSAPDMPWDVDINLKNITLGDQKFLRNFTGTLAARNSEWAEGKMTATLDVPSKANITKDHQLVIERGLKKGELVTKIRSQDGGAFLKAFDIYDAVEGGELKITLHQKRNIKKAPQTGELKIKNFVVVDAPFMTRFLSLASPGGVMDFVSGNKISFGEFRTQFSMVPEKITLTKGLAKSVGLGVTVQGVVGRKDPTINLSGNVIPAYILNSLLGNIPILGDLLTGGKGEGLLSASYTVTGHKENPTIGVNPVSILTPGIFKKLFEESYIDQDDSLEDEDKKELKDDNTSINQN